MKEHQKKLIKISQKTNGRCFYCNRSGEVVDHFISKSQWKEEEIDELLGEMRDELCNLFIACQECNSKKSNKNPEKFIGNRYKTWDRFSRANKRVNIKNSFELAYGRW